MEDHGSCVCNLGNCKKSLKNTGLVGIYMSTQWESRDGAVARALAFHQCGPGSIPGPGVIIYVG